MYHCKEIPIHVMEQIRSLPELYPTPSALYSIFPGAIIRALAYKPFMALVVEITGFSTLAMDEPHLVGPGLGLTIAHRGSIDYVRYRDGEDYDMYDMPNLGKTATFFTHEFEGAGHVPSKQRGYYLTFD